MTAALPVARQVHSPAELLDHTRTPRPPWTPHTSLTSCAGAFSVAHARPPCHLPPHAVQYSLWLDNHSQAEALKFIRTALEACAARARGAPGADELLPLLRRLAADAS